MNVPQINNHVQQGLDRLLQQYKGQPNIEGLLTALINQIQDLENALYPLDKYRQLAFAYGAQLDQLGKIIGRPRNGLPDNEYFIFLIGEIAKNNSDTTAPTLLYIVQTLFQSPKVYIFSPESNGGGDGGFEPPATVGFGVSDPGTEASLDTVIEQIIIASLGAGIGLAFLSKFNTEHAFAFAGPQPWVAGFSDLNNPLPTDGLFADLIFNNLSQ